MSANIQHKLIKQSAKVQSKNTKQRHEGRTQKQRHNTKTQSKDTTQKHKVKHTKQETLQPNRRPNIQHKLIKQSAKAQESKSTHKAEAQSKSTKQEQQEKHNAKTKSGKHCVQTNRTDGQASICRGIFCQRNNKNHSAPHAA